MKIMKVSSPEGSFCSTELKSITKYINDHLLNTLKQKGENKILVEVFEISDEKQSLSSEVETSSKRVA